MRKTTFLLPGVCGDEPDLVVFRDRLRAEFDFTVVALPDAGSPGAVLTDMAATAAFVVAQIVAHQPAGPVSLIGFSFGASTALEVAAQLADQGRAIAFLGVLDGPFASDEMQGWFELLRRATSAKQTVRTLFEVAASTDATRRIAWSAVSPDHVGRERSDPVRRAMLAHLRGKALKGWQPRTCLAQGVLLRTATFGEANRARWTALCPNLRPVEIGGRHEDLLHDGSLEAVVETLRRTRAPTDVVTPV